MELCGEMSGYLCKTSWSLYQDFDLRSEIVQAIWLLDLFDRLLLRTP